MNDNNGPLFELDRARMTALLNELSDRLETRGIAASLYLVGGAAMTLAYGREGLTPDIDALTSHAAVLDEAASMAQHHGLPEGWLNSNAAGWVPPRPEWALTQPTEPGLTIHIAPPEHVLAMKLIATRRKDRPDIRLLISEVGMEDAPPEEYADLLARVYDGEGLLSTMLGIREDDPAATRTEAMRIGEWAHQFASELRNG